MKRSTLTGLLGLTTGMIMGVVGCKTCNCVKKMVKECHSCKTICDYDDYCECDDYDECVDEDFDLDNEEVEYDIEYKYEPNTEAVESDEMAKAESTRLNKDNKQTYNVETKEKDYKDESKDNLYEVENKNKGKSK